MDIDVSSGATFFRRYHFLLLANIAIKSSLFFPKEFCPLVIMCVSTSSLCIIKDGILQKVQRYNEIPRRFYLWKARAFKSYS